MGSNNYILGLALPEIRGTADPHGGAYTPPPPPPHPVASPVRPHDSSRQVNVDRRGRYYIHTCALHVYESFL